MVVMGKELDAHSARVRDSIHDQNDLVLMISIMMEMPIPYANHQQSRRHFVPASLQGLQATIDVIVVNNKDALSCHSTDTHCCSSVKLPAHHTRTLWDLPADRMRQLKGILDLVLLLGVS